MKNPFTIESDWGKGGDLTGKFRNNWVEESFDIEGDSNSKLSIAHTRRYIGTSISRKKIVFFLLVFFLAVSILLGRVIQIQIIKGDYYRTLAEGNRIRILPIPSERGMVYDRYGTDLLKNVPDFLISITPQDIPRQGEERKNVINRISAMTGISDSDIGATLDRFKQYSYQTFTIKDNLKYEDALRLYIEFSDVPGVQIESGSRRGYDFKTASSSKPEIVESLSHIIGYVGKLNDEELLERKDLGYLPSDLIGKTGLENSYESILRGEYGRKKIEVNAIGKEQSVLAVEAPTPGSNLTISLDLAAQKKLESIVKNAAAAFNKKRISAVALDPKSGEVLAMVSWPAFDNNLFAAGISNDDYNKYAQNEDRPLFNRVVTGRYPPGSTVKLVVSAAALQEKIITKNTTVNSVGGITVGGSLFKDWKAGGHGYTNVTKAIAWSVNTFFYYVGGGFEKFTGLGIDRLEKYFHMFGLGLKTGIDLPNESSGFVPDRDWKKRVKNEQWFVGDTYNISIGQGDLLVSPLQAAVWTAAVANGGTIITPHLGKQTTDPLTKKTTDLKYPSRKVDVSEYNLQLVREGMRECVTSGSCGLLRGLKFSSAGKTGTAQWSKTKPTHAWFTAFAPYNKPSVVVTVLVEDGGEGSVVAQPIAKSFLEWWGGKYIE